METTTDSEKPDNMSNLVTTIVLRCTAKVCVGLTPDRIIAVADPLVSAVTDLIVLQHEEREREFVVRTNNYVVFELMARIVAEIAKEIPCAKYILVIGENVTSKQRDEYIATYLNPAPPTTPPRKGTRGK